MRSTDCLQNRITFQVGWRLTSNTSRSAKTVWNGYQTLFGYWQTFIDISTWMHGVEYLPCMPFGIMTMNFCRRHSGFTTAWRQNQVSRTGRRWAKRLTARKAKTCLGLGWQTSRPRITGSSLGSIFFPFCPTSVGEQASLTLKLPPAWALSFHNDCRIVIPRRQPSRYCRHRLQFPVMK